MEDSAVRSGEQQNSQQPEWNISLPSIPFWGGVVACVVVAAVVLSSMWETRFPIFSDEAIYSDIVSRFLAGNGFSTYLFQYFITGVEHHSLWYPPVYFLSLAGVYAVFGEGIVQARFFSIVTTLVVLLIVAVFLRQQKKSVYLVLLGLLLVLGDPFVQSSAVVARMEMLTLFLGFLSLVSFWSAESSKKMCGMDFLAFSQDWQFSLTLWV